MNDMHSRRPDRLMPEIALPTAAQSGHCPVCSAAACAEADYLESLAGAALTDIEAVQSFVAAGGFCARHAAAAVTTPGMMETMPLLLGELARANWHQLERAQADLARHERTDLSRTGTCPACMEQQRAVAECTLRALGSPDGADSKSRENGKMALCFPHLLFMLAEDRLRRESCRDITAACHTRLAALMDSGTYEQKLAMHSRIPDSAAVDEILRMLAGNSPGPGVAREGAPRWPMQTIASAGDAYPSHDTIHGCPVCLRLCDAWRTRLAMLDGNAESHQDFDDLMPAAPENVWPMCARAHGTLLHSSIATAGAYRMLAVLRSLMLHYRTATQPVPFTGIRPFVHTIHERRQARGAFISACRHPFTCPVDRFLRGVERHQLSRLLSALRGPEASASSHPTPGLCMVHLRAALSMAPDVDISQLLLHSALALSRQILMIAAPTSTQPVAPAQWEPALRFFSGVDYRWTGAMQGSAAY